MKGFYEVCGCLAICFVMFIWGIYIGNNAIPKERKMVSYEYTIQCRCGGTIEGYQSLVDDYNREECKSCGYHKE